MGVLVEEEIENMLGPPFREGELVDVYENNIIRIRNGIYLAFWTQRGAHVILPPSRSKPGATKLDAVVYLPGFNGQISRAGALQEAKRSKK